jgi:ABC-2 type transport system permease protein
MALIEKEFVLILRNKHLLFLLIFPTTIQLVILGFALNPGLRHESIVVVDGSRTAASRSLVAALENTGMFTAKYVDTAFVDFSRIFDSGAAKAILNIPRTFPLDLDRLHKAEVQYVLDGTDAYTASLARGYLTETTLHAGRGVEPLGSVQPVVHMMFNPGLISAWYFIPGLLGALLTLSATLVSSAVMLRERDTGTLESLLMLPVTSGEMFVAKVLPIFTLLFLDLLIAFSISILVFSLPVRGSVVLFFGVSAVFIITMVGVGVLLGSVSKNQKQAKLLSFFINIPIVLLSGIVVPFTTMPQTLQTISWLDPLRFYRACAGGILLKGSTVTDLWPEITALFVSCLIIVTVNIWRLRTQSL